MNNNNTPTLMQSEEKEAPWNEKIKTISVDISVSLSNTVEIEVPEDFDESDNKTLERIVMEQVYLPQDVIATGQLRGWIIDEFCVAL